MIASEVSRTLQDKVIVALDVPPNDALPVLRPIKHLKPRLKVGLEILTGAGVPNVMRFLGEEEVASGSMLDLKLCDIPNTVAGAVRQVALLKPSPALFTMHASAGVKAMKAAVENQGTTRAVAVTVLTSLSDEDFAGMGFTDGLFPGYAERLVWFLSKCASEAGIEYVVCSPLELDTIVKDPVTRHLKCITPGVRPEWASHGDQKRVMTPAEAIRRGAHAIVIGRPVLQPPGTMPSEEALLRVYDEVAKAL